MCRQRFRRLRFPYQWWGVHDRVLNNLPRTNNGMEGWHNHFNQHVGYHHANIWKLIGVLKSEEDISRLELTHIQQGRPPRNANPVYSRVNRHVMTVVASYENREPLEYLRGIAHNLMNFRILYIFRMFVYILFHYGIFICYIARGKSLKKKCTKF